jgi:hypothetical protein
MSSTYSTNLAIELMGAGEQAGNWGSTTNTNLGTLIEQAISGYTTQVCTGGTDTLAMTSGASATARNMFIELTGTGGGNLVVPANKKLYFIYNNTSSAITVKVTTGVSVPAAAKILLVCNGTDIITAINYMASLTLGAALPVLSGGTGVTTSTGSGANVLATSPTLVTPILGTPQSGTLTNCTFPTLNQNTTGTAAGLSVTLAVASGGTGVTSSTGSGAVVLNSSPTLTSPALGTPTALVGTNITGTAAGLSIGGSAATATSATSATNVTGTVAIANGGTGLTATPSNGQIDIGNGSGFTRTTLTAGSGISITNGAGSVSIASVGGGTVTSVATGNGLSGGTITSTGTLTIAAPTTHSIGSYAFFYKSTNSRLFVGNTISGSNLFYISAVGPNIQLPSFANANPEGNRVNASSSFTTGASSYTITYTNVTGTWMALTSTELSSYDGCNNNTGFPGGLYVRQN